MLGALLPAGAWAQVSNGQTAAVQSAIGARVDALTILGGDFGFADGNYHSGMAISPAASGTVRTGVTKIGGDGDIGDPIPLGDLGIGWQPRLQGSMGYLESTARPGTPLSGDTNRLEASSIEFGGGARFWTSEHLSFAPTLMLLYGHASNTYTAHSAFALEGEEQLEQLGLFNWNIDTLSLRSALNVQYIIPLDRARITVSTDAAAFVTRSLSRSTREINASGESGFMTNKIDVDVPLGVAFLGHELRAGGYLSRTELFGELRDGLAVDHLNEVHARVALDFLGQFWKVQWLGMGASYVWGPNINGWTWGADVTFRF